MEHFLITGGNRLEGEIDLHGAKNAFLPIMAGSILAEGKTRLIDFSKISDIYKMGNILSSIGCNVEYKDRDIFIDSTNCSGYSISDELMQGIRASIFMLGPILSRHKKAKMAYPGGCAIGNRPIDIHLEGLRALNVKIIEEHGHIICDGTNMKASTIHLRFASVGATENLVMASVFLEGETTLNNVACEPEVVDLCNFLNKMGAKISGMGTSTIVVKGVKKLNAVEYKPISDRIVAGTFLLATLVTKGKVQINNINPKYLQIMLNLLKDNNCKIETKNDKIYVQTNKRMKSIPILETMPYPLFPTDLQAQMMVLQAVSKGNSVIIENLFDSRFKQASELVKMGAKIKLQGSKAIITGVDKLSGARVSATDLRAGASLVMAGMFADGYTIVENIHLIDRGYESLENTFNLLGANIKRVS